MTLSPHEITAEGRPQRAPAQFWTKVRKTLHHHAKQSIVSARGAIWDVARWPADHPVFIVSCSRSGTQMLYKTISESRKIGTLNREIYAIWSKLHSPSAKNWETHRLDADDAGGADRDFITRYFYSHTGHRRFVDKNNQHGLAVPYLHALFPNARFVYIKRNPGDTLNSMIEGWGKPERYGSWAADLPAKVAIDGGRYSTWCHFLPDGWRSYLDASIEEVCAFQYAAIHRALLDARIGIHHRRWHEVFYEDIVRDPVHANREIFRFCNLPFTREIEAHCASLLDKPYDAFSEIRLGKWRDQRHRERIERVLPSLAPLAREMGYTI